MTSLTLARPKTPVRTRFAPAAPATNVSFLDDAPALEPAPPPVRTRRKGIAFNAELEATELDDRNRTGPTWVSRACEISRAHIVLRSRRVCYIGRQLVFAIHLIDDRPAPMAGRVYSCEYDSDGQYLTTIDLEPLPDLPSVREWIKERGRR